MLKLTRRKLHSCPTLLKVLPSYDAVKSRFTFSKESSSIQNILKRPNERHVVVNGWIDGKPKKVNKSLIFGKLRDSDGQTIQLVDSLSLLKQSQVEDVVQVQGKLVQKKLQNPHEDAQYEIKLTSINTLNASGKEPSQLQDFKVTGNYPPEYRYLQLRLPIFQERLKTRYEASKVIRNTLDSFKFTEIETPLLFKSTPEGAREFLVPTRYQNDGNPLVYALPQSPQQYKQLLIASGVKNYYQIARCFRDEDLRSDRQPEFTQVDLEMAFANSTDVMAVVEKTVTDVWNTLCKNGNLHTLDKSGQIVPVSDEVPIKQLSYEQVMTVYGIDKPNLKFAELKLIALNEFNVHGHANRDFPVFEVMVLRNAFSSSEDYEANWAHLSNSKEYNYRTPIVVPILNEGTESTWFEQFLSIAHFENPKLVKNFLRLKVGDIICGCTRQPKHAIFENPTPLGRLRQLVIQSKRGKELYQTTNKDVASWVVDFPLFSPVESPVAYSKSKQLYPRYEKDKLTSTHHPFTMVKLEHYDALSHNPLSCLGQHYDLVVNGVELGGGSTRIHDPELQRYIFNQILKIESEEVIFGHLLRAFSMGTPPHAGFAIGFDRLVAMLCGSETIRDVIAFPKSITGSDLVVGSPSAVNDETLRNYNLSSRRIKNRED
ncbi:aspartate--tRNA ligase MSD1 Ecym_7077 [Eremothecium cymbalariae DBVPG|uniref:Aminoacyl-transfer RNA synthetases class-II family profile domain-containing protein n=1 Tax=Eremothecium cymbalariae (strain CBS 270.75 / DBVPG 7215 / KCTC 17166 / NRRL Y-17582) TaxID=931890 RepID=G8JVR5_ERECY|nr:hypothetical protein Ecym_7077 [Eremothecium cymbalariae DBVPG\